MSAGVITNYIYWSDHFPLEVSCSLRVIKSKIKIDVNVCRNIMWGSREPDEIDKYSEFCNNKFKYIDFPVELHNCADRMCHSLDHRLIIDKLYHDIVDILTQASIESSNIKSKKFNKCKIVYGWNKHVREAHAQARLDYQNYVLYGKPEGGPILQRMRNSRKVFKSR